MPSRVYDKIFLVFRSFLVFELFPENSKIRPVLSGIPPWTSSWITKVRPISSEVVHRDRQNLKKNLSEVFPIFLLDSIAVFSRISSYVSPKGIGSSQDIYLKSSWDYSRSFSRDSSWMVYRDCVRSFSQKFSWSFSREFSPRQELFVGLLRVTPKILQEIFCGISSKTMYFFRNSFCNLFKKFL